MLYNRQNGSGLPPLKHLIKMFSESNEAWKETFQSFLLPWRCFYKFIWIYFATDLIFQRLLHVERQDIFNSPCWIIEKRGKNCIPLSCDYFLRWFHYYHFFRNYILCLNLMILNCQNILVVIVSLNLWCILLSFHCETKSSTLAWCRVSFLTDKWWNQLKHFSVCHFVFIKIITEKMRLVKLVREMLQKKHIGYAYIILLNFLKVINQHPQFHLLQVRRDVLGETKYVELVIINDFSQVRKISC